MSTSNAEKHLEVGMLIRLGGLLSRMAVLFLTDELVGSAGTISMDVSVVSIFHHWLSVIYDYLTN
jgi:hypothetical protein